MPGFLRRHRRHFLVLASLVLLLGGGALALWLSTPDVSGLAVENPSTTAFLELRRRQAAVAGRPFRLRWTWVPLSAVSPALRQAVVLAEDRRFYRHGGVDPKAIRRALRESMEEGRPLVGASTITQQLARNLYLSPDRNPIRKLREAVIAWRLEAALDKDRILELYLNVVEWGEGVFGAEAAARTWYRCSASDLTLAQAVRLAIALPNPRTRSPAADDPDLVREAARLVARLCLRGDVDLEARDEAFLDLGVTEATRPPDYLLHFQKAER
jgi:monofunctional biosynthetic peptidoglycan transglycosylase